MSDMNEWMELNKPNEHHEHLLRSVGEWSVAGKFWMAPGAPPMEADGQSTITAMLDGRYVRNDYSSNFAGAPFSGVGIDGYDNTKQKYVSLWIDSMSTGFSFQEGTREGNVTTTLGEMPGMNGATRKVKGVATTTDDDNMTFCMYEQEGDDWRMTMELIYSRKT